MCLRRKKKVEIPVAVPAAQPQVEKAAVDPMDIFLDISMVPVAPPKASGVIRPEVLPEEFVIYTEKSEKDNI